MPTRRLKPDTPSRRYMSISTFEEITSKKPERKLTTALRKTGGRNNHGRITSRHRGGGHRRRYRIIDSTNCKPFCSKRPRISPTKPR